MALFISTASQVMVKVLVPANLYGRCEGHIYKLEFHSRHNHHTHFCQYEIACQLS